MATTTNYQQHTIPSLMQPNRQPPQPSETSITDSTNAILPPVSAAQLLPALPTAPVKVPDPNKQITKRESDKQQLYNSPCAVFMYICV